MNGTTSPTCERCHGAGVVTEQRSRWIGGTRSGYCTAYALEVRCPACNGQSTPEPEPTPPAGRLTIAGHVVTAPGFTAETFDRAIQRAHDEGLRIEATDRPDMVRCVNPAHGTAYTVSRRSCSCKAGQAGRPCKHRALACFLADIVRALPVPAPSAAA